MSVLEFLPESDLLVVDDGSDEPRQHDVLAELESQGVDVQRANVPSEGLHGGLYVRMNEAISYAIERGYDYVNLVQDDMQWMWHEPTLIDTLDALFDSLPDAAQVGAAFAKAIMPNLEQRLLPAAGGRCYVDDSYGMADTGIVRLELLRQHAFTFRSLEAATSAFWVERGYRLYHLRDPQLAWLPHPFLLDRSVGESPNRYYLEPLSVEAVGRLRSRPISALPFHEDYCCPWGWGALSPFGFSTYHDYPRMLLRSSRRRIPRWVGRRPWRARVPTRSWLARDLVSRCWGKLR
jgi:hypothetical protein